MADTTKVVTVQAANERYVCKIARSCSGPSTKAELNEGQNIHKNTLPIIAKRSVWYDALSISPTLAFSFDGLRIKLTANPK